MTKCPHATTTRRDRKAAAVFRIGECNSAAAHAASLLRHPRSLARITPGWRAPSMSVAIGNQEITIHVTRRRISTIMWESIHGGPAPDQPLYLATLTAEFPRWMAPYARHVLDAVAAPAWSNREENTESPDGQIVQHLLLTQEQLHHATGPMREAA